MAATIRRLYLYLVAFISLDLLVSSVLNLVRILSYNLAMGRITTDERLEATSYIALLLVSGVVYAVHWLLCWRFACTGDDRASAIRAVYLYGILAVAMAMVLHDGYNLLERVLAAGQILPPTRRLQAEYPGLLANLALAGVLWGLHALVRHRDAAPGPATARRLYAYGLSAAGLTVLALGLIDLLQWCVAQVLIANRLGIGHVPAFLYGKPTEAVARLAVGGAIWLGHALWCQRRTAADPDERQSVLRHAYLYLILQVTTTAALAGVAFIVKGLWDLVLGDGGVGDVGALLSDLNAPASLVVVCWVFWLLHRLLLWRDVRRMDEAPFQVHLRRLHGHLMAGIGLALTIGGGANLLHAILRMASTALAPGTPTVTSGAALRDEVSVYATLLMVGLPVWLLHWIRMQREARPGDPAGAWRRIYLYLVFLSSALAFLFNATWMLYALLNVVLGLEPLHQLGSDLRDPVSNLVIYGMLWGYHLFVLARAVRAERRHEAERAAVALPVGTIAVVDDGDGILGALVLDRLCQENTGATLVPVGLTLAAAEAMASVLGEVPADVDEVSAQVQQADVLVGPVRVLLAQPADGPFPTLTAALAASPARRVILPLSDDRHVLVGWAPRSVDTLARRAVRWALEIARDQARDE